MRATLLCLSRQIEGSKEIAGDLMSLVGDEAACKAALNETIADYLGPKFQLG